MFTRSLFGFFSLICFVLTYAGYNAPIISITVTPLADRTISPTRDPNVNLVKVEAVVDARFIVRSPVVLRVSRVNGEGQPITQNMTAVDQTGGPLSRQTIRYRVDNLAVPQGKLRYEVEVPYTILPISETHTARKVIEEISLVRNSCFFFNSATPGWTASAYKHWYGQTDQPACGALVRPVLRESTRLGMSLVAALNEQGQSRPGCFTDSGNWDFTSADFVSPDLIAIPGWAGAKGFDLQAVIEGLGVMGEPNEPIKVQLLIELRNGRLYGESDANGRFIFHDVEEDGPFFGFSKSKAATDDIRRIRIRVFARRVVAQPNEGMITPFVYIDRICPRY